MSKQYDYVVLDGPPIDEAPESIALSSKVDGVILVIDASRTRGKIALRAKKRIEESGGRLLGAVLNRRRYYVPDWLYRMF
jgi:Mrp family chromosome partitioning ATPase